MGVFTVFDSKAAAYHQPFYSPNESTALRAIRHSMMDPTHQFRLSPEDYSVVKVGSWDDQIGKLEAVSPPEMVAPIAAIVNDIERVALGEAA